MLDSLPGHTAFLGKSRYGRPAITIFVCISRDETQHSIRGVANIWIGAGSLADFGKAKLRSESSRTFSGGPCGYGFTNKPGGYGSELLTHELARY